MLTEERSLAVYIASHLISDTEPSDSVLMSVWASNKTDHIARWPYYQHYETI